MTFWFNREIKYLHTAKIRNYHLPHVLHEVLPHVLHEVLPHSSSQIPILKYMFCFVLQTIVQLLKWLRSFSYPMICLLRQ